MRSKGQLWSCRGVGRVKKLKLLHLVASSSFSWCVGAWTITQRSLVQLNAQFTRVAKTAVRAVHYFGDTDEMYHRRCNKLLRKCMVESGLPDLQVYVLGRMFDHTGYLVRSFSRSPNHLTGRVMAFRDAAWKRAMTHHVGHQGHSGRFAPWNWERQYDSYFALQGLEWKQVAADKAAWSKHRRSFVEHMLGTRRSYAIRSEK